MYKNQNIFSNLDTKTSNFKYVQKFAAYVLTKKIKKREFVLKAGEINDHLIYLKKGLMRVYFVNNEKEINTWFVKDDEFITSIDSYINEVPSIEYIQAIEDSEIYMIKKSTYNFLIRNNHKLALFAIEMFYLTLCEYQEQCQTLRFMNAEQKYEFLKIKRPDLIARISQKNIASFLGVETTYMSKIISNNKNEMS